MTEPDIGPPVTEPDLHDVGPTPRRFLGVPDPDEPTEADWLAQRRAHEEDGTR